MCVADRPRDPPPSAVLEPFHASPPREILYALYVRDWRHLLASVNHAGLRRRLAGFRQLAPLTPKLRAISPKSPSAAIRNQLVNV